MIKIIKLFPISIFLMLGAITNAQSSYHFSVGTVIPDQITKKYLKPGINLNYGLEFKLHKNFSLSTDISASYNFKNPNYTFGFDDDPVLNQNPEIKNFIQYMLSSSPDHYDTYILQLIDPSIGTNLKYSLLSKKLINPYFFAGIKVCYSLVNENLSTYTLDPGGMNATETISGDDLEKKINIAYQAGLGIRIGFKNGKALFIQAQYKMQPSIKFGRNNDRVGLYIADFGFSCPFKKKGKKNESTD